MHKSDASLCLYNMYEMLLEQVLGHNEEILLRDFTVISKDIFEERWLDGNSVSDYEAGDEICILAKWLALGMQFLKLSPDESFIKLRRLKDQYQSQHITRFGRVLVPFMREVCGWTLHGQEMKKFRLGFERVRIWMNKTLRNRQVKWMDENGNISSGPAPMAVDGAPGMSSCTYFSTSSQTLPQHLEREEQNEKDADNEDDDDDDKDDDIVIDEMEEDCPNWQHSMPYGNDAEMENSQQIEFATGLGTGLGTGLRSSWPCAWEDA